MTSPDVMHMKHEEAYHVDPTPPSSDAAVVRADDRREDENVDSEDDTTQRDSEDNNMQKDSEDPAPVDGASGTIILPMQGSEFRRNDKGDVLCHVEGCETVMSEETAYFRRYKICRKHLKSNYLIVAGIQQRFCQQCGKFHEVEKFDGTKRNCRATLVRHNRRRKKTSRAKRKKSASEDEGSDMRQPNNATWEHPGMGGMLNSSPVNVDILKAYYGVPNPNDAFPPELVNTIAELERLIGREVIHHCLQSSQPPQMWQQNGYATNYNIFQGNGMNRYSPAPVHQSPPMMNAFHQYGVPMSAPQHPYTSGGMPMPPPSARKQVPKGASDSMMDQTASDILMRMKNSLPPKSQYMRMPM